MPSDSRATLQPALARYSTRWKVCSQSSLSKMPSAASLLSMGTQLSLPGRWRERGRGKESKEASKGKRVRKDYQRQTPTESRERESEMLRFALLQIRKLHLPSVDDERSFSYISVLSLEAATGHEGVFESVPDMFSSSDVLESHWGLSSVEEHLEPSTKSIELYTSRWNLNGLFGLRAQSSQDWRPRMLSLDLFYQSATM